MPEASAAGKRLKRLRNRPAAQTPGHPGKKAAVKDPNQRRQMQQ